MTDQEKQPIFLDLELSEKWQCLLTLLQGMKKVAVAYSGGVDSSLLSYAAYAALKDQMTAYTIHSPVDSPGELENAILFSQKAGFSHEILVYDDLVNDSFVSNPADRCYFCKRNRFSYILKRLGTDSGVVIVEGSNVDDQRDYRPGFKAVQQLGVRSPLLEVGLKKDEIRRLARGFDLPMWNHPSTPCLATRFPYQTKITSEGLTKVSQAEGYLLTLGFNPVRVRYYGDLAKIEINQDQFPGFIDQKDEIITHLLQIGFRFISLDLEGFQSGRLNRMLS